MKLYAYDDGSLSLQIYVTHEMVAKYHRGERSMIHLPVSWRLWSRPSLAQLSDPDEFTPRPVQPGDEIGLAAGLPRIRVTPIAQIDKIQIQDVASSDIPLLGFSSLDEYRQRWDECWGDAAPAEGGPWPWDENPEVYAIRWKPLEDPFARPDVQANACPPPTKS